MSILSVEVREKAFGDSVILRDVRVTLEAGEAAALLGPSGCGKSTLLRIAAGLDRNFTGRVEGGEPESAGGRPPLAFVFQEPRLFPWLTVAENVGYADGRRYDRGRVEALLADVGLAGSAETLPKALSGGMAQRAALARALYTEPRILLLDEPFSAVDAFTRMKLQDLALSLVARRGVGFLLVTHDIDEALYLGDRIAIMGARPGRIQRELTVDLPRPRDRRDRRLADLKGEILTSLHEAHAI